jgi:hypothetical protein
MGRALSPDRAFWSTFDISFLRMYNGSALSGRPADASSHRERFCRTAQAAC